MCWDPEAMSVEIKIKWYGMNNCDSTQIWRSPTPNCLLQGQPPSDHQAHSEAFVTGAELMQLPHIV